MSVALSDAIWLVRDVDPCLRRGDAQGCKKKSPAPHGGDAGYLSGKGPDQKRVRRVTPP